MSGENLAIVRQLVDAFGRGDLDTVFSLAGPKPVFRNRSKTPGVDGVYLGREGLLEMLAKIYDVFADYRVDPLDFEARGDRVAVLYRETGHGRTSGIEVDRRIVLIYTLEAGKVISSDALTYRHASLREALDEQPSVSE